MKKSEAFGPFEAIEEQLDQIAKSLGLTLEMFGIIINKNPELHEFQCQFTIRPEAVMSEAEREQAVFDKQFEAIDREEREREMHDEKLPRLLDTIDTWLQDDNPE